MVAEVIPAPACGGPFASVDFVPLGDEPQYAGAIEFCLDLRGQLIIGELRGNAWLHGAGLGQSASDPKTDVSASFSGSHSSAGQSVRPISVRSAVQARVGPLEQAVAADVITAPACGGPFASVDFVPLGDEHQYVGAIDFCLDFRGQFIIGELRGNTCLHGAGLGQSASDAATDFLVSFSGAPSSAGHSVRPITARSAVQARVGPLGQGVDSQGAPGASMRGAHAPMFTLCDLGLTPSSSGPYM